MIAVFLLLAACASNDPVAEALAPLPANPVEALARCERQAFPELAIPCRVEVAARVAGKGDYTQANEICALLPEGTWRHECHFRAGEELAARGAAVEALRHCVQAGNFARFCLTHAGWGLPPEPDFPAEAAPGVALIQRRVAEVDAALHGAPDGLDTEGMDIFRSRLWFNAYLGTGAADPAMAREATSDLAPHARGAFALEAVRLAFIGPSDPPADAVDRILRIWSGQDPPPRGAPLDPRERVGRYHSPIPAPPESGTPCIHTYGGGMRLVGADEDEDMVIATLEALYFRRDTPADLFVAWVDDPRERVRRSAARLLRLSPPRSLDMEATLQGLLQHPDKGVAWHAADGLTHRTWEPRRAGPR